MSDQNSRSGPQTCLPYRKEILATFHETNFRKSNFYVQFDNAALQHVCHFGRNRLHYGSTAYVMCYTVI